MILHGFHQRVNGLFAIIRKAGVGIIAKRIGFVNEQNTAHGFCNYLTGLFRCCAKILAYKAAAIYFDNLVFGQNSIFIENSRNIACNLRLAGTGIAQKAHMNIQILAAFVGCSIGLDFLNVFFDAR